jgi:hypothetical protein
MNEPLIIGTDGKLYTRTIYAHKDLISSFKKTVDIISKWDLVPQKLIMNKADYDDIVKWSKE